MYFVVPPYRFWDAEPERPTGPIRTARVPAPAVEDERDPTGCGDVFGAAMFAALLADTEVEVALARANAYAARNVQYLGASDLQYHLRGEIVPR